MTSLKLKACINPAQTQARQNHSMESGDKHRVFPLSEELLTSSCYERESPLSSGVGTSIMLGRKAIPRSIRATPTIPDVAFKEDTKLGGFRRGVLGKVGGEYGYDQNTSYQILMELIKLIKNEILSKYL